MRTIKLTLLLTLCLAFVNTTFSQDGVDPELGIQLATYSSQKSLNANLPKLNALQTGALNHLFLSHRTGNQIKVYLVGEYGYFYPGMETDDALKAVKANKGFEGAFLKRINDERLKFKPLLVNTVTNPLDNDDDLTAKGGEQKTEKRYRVQLGVFSELKSPEYIASAYGLTSWEKTNFDRVVQQDFTKVDDEVCRRYTYGAYHKKSDARKAKRKLEKKSGRKLMLIKK